jgi:hypothetical protein
MFHALMGRFQLELFIFITYFSTVVPVTSYVFFLVGLLLLMLLFNRSYSFFCLLSTAQARRQKKPQDLLKMSH